MAKKYVVGIDVGATKICAGLFTPSGKLLERSKSSTPHAATPQQVIAVIKDLVKEVLSQADIKKRNLTAIGLGIPGIIDTAQGKIINTPNMRLAGFPIGPRLKKVFSLPVAVGNDVNVGLLGEQWQGAAKGKNNVIGLFLGTGLGGALIINNRLFTGANSAAGEIGHMIVDPNGPRCGCGNRGCLEALTARWAIERDIRSHIKQGSRSLVKDLLKNPSGRIKSKILRKALKKKDPLVTGVLTRVSVTLGSACISLRHIFDPELFVFGGGVIEACADFMLPVIRRTVEKDPFFRKLKPCTIAAATLGDDAIITGAAALVSRARA